jgi:hypothetical protein
MRASLRVNPQEPIARCGMIGACETLPYALFGWGEFKRIHQCPEMQTGPADNDQAAVRGHGVVHDRTPGNLILAHGVVPVGLDHVDQVMADRGSRGPRRFGRSDVHASIHLHGVD